MTFTQEQLINQAREEVDFWRERDELIPSQQTAIRLRLAEITLAALTADPVYQLINYDWYDTTKDVYESVVSAGGRGRIVYAAPPATVVPPAIEPDYDVIKGILPTSNPDEYACCIAADMWNACRAATLQGNHRDLSYPVDPQIAAYETIMEQAIPDGYALVPVDMAPEMMRAVQLNSELGGYAAANLSGAYSLFREFWDVAIAAAPDFREIPDSSTNNCRENAETSTNEWIACSERMPEAGQKVLAYRPDAPESDDPLIRMATYVGRSAHGHGFDCYCKPSHWMALPAAPQQEVK